MVQRLFGNRIKEIMGCFDENEIISCYNNANFFGLESWGLMQVRGIGMLVLTKNELFFGMYKPAKNLSIPLKSILKVKTKDKSHLKKSKFKRLLKIIFLNDEKEDSAAWLIKNVDGWGERIWKLTGLSEDAKD